jgi:hypothetical protein
MRWWRTLGATLGTSVAVLLLPAAASADPTVTTLPASNVYWVSAQVNGSFSSDQSGRWSIELGQTTAYGRTVAEDTFTPGSYAPSAVTNGLMAGTTYHYRLVVTLDSQPTTPFFGEDQMFMTLAPTGPAVLGIDFVSVWDSHAGANVEFDLDDGGAPTQWWIDYGTTPALGQTSSVGVAPATDSGQTLVGQLCCLQPYLTYYYRVGAQNSVGHAYGNVESFQAGTPPPPPPPPRPPPHPTVSLTVYKSQGGVVAQPNGLVCASVSTTCLFPVPSGTAVTLNEQPDPGMVFAGWGGACRDHGTETSCTITATGDQTVSASFERPAAPVPAPPQRCHVPRVLGLTLARAKTKLRADHCRVGHVGYAFSRKVRRGRVLAQSRRPGTKAVKGAAVRLTVSRGPHRRR